MKVSAGLADANAGVPKPTSEAAMRPNAIVTPWAIVFAPTFHIA
ncbi:hypothetical protein [Saccharopolyspora aridisoli]|nr:hypothetical protein [Saccharopolyspora aridisoli]